MEKFLKIGVLIMFLIGGTLFLFNNFVTNYNQEIEKTKHKIEGVEFAQKLQKFILKLQKLRGYSQFEEMSVSEANWDVVKNSVEMIKTDVKKDIFNIKRFNSLYPTLFDEGYIHIINEIETLLENSNKEDRTILYQKYTHIIAQLHEKMYNIGFKSRLLLESESDKYFYVETMLKNIPNFIEVIGKIRAKTTKAIMDKSTNAELKYSIQNNCLICEEHTKQIYKTISEIGNDTEKTRLLSMLESIHVETNSMREYVKNTIMSDKTNIDALEFFTIATNLIDKAFSLYSVNAEFLNQKLYVKLGELNETKRYGIIIGAIVVLFIFLTIFSMIRSYMLYSKSEKKIKNNLTSIIKLKNDLEKCKTIQDISSSALYFFSNKFNIIQGAIYLFNEENNKLYLASSYATNEMKPIVELGEGLIGEVAIQMKHIHIHSNSTKTHFKIESTTIEPNNICTIPLISYDKIFGVLQLGFLGKNEIIHNDDFQYFIDMIIGFLRDAKHLETTKKYIELIDKHVITSKTNTKGIITDVSDAFTKISGYSKKEIIGKSHSVVAHPDTPKEVYENLWKTILSGKIYKGEVKNLNKNGNEYWIETTITPQMDKYNNILGFSAIIRDITDKKRIEEYSITDALTGLYNRRFFDSNFTKEYKISKRDNKNLVLLIIDIDYFKQYNDFYGHQKGDEVLKSISVAMKSSFKRANDYVYRLGGEEFAISFYSNNQKNALERAEFLRKNIEDLKIEHQASDISKYVSISIGLSFMTKECTMEIDEIYNITDEALYKAKNSGRNRIESAVFNP